jgi:glutamine synthetase
MDSAMTGRLEPGELAAHGIDTVIIAGTDVQGRLFGKRMSPCVFETKLDEGLHICTCVYAWDMDQALEGIDLEFAGPHTGWHDFRLVPDTSTLRVAAWLDHTAICLGDAVSEDGSRLAIAPRSILRGQVEQLDAMGLHARTATELEFYLYIGRPGDLRAEGYHALRPTTDVHADYNVSEANAMEPFFRQLRRCLDDSDVEVDVAQVEYGLGQWEINLHHQEPVEMADRHVLFKQAVKDLARTHGYTATFMPRPATSELGSSCHIHASLLDGDGVPVFHSATDPAGSKELSRAVAGVLAGAPDLMSWYAPTINSYRRTRSKDFAGNGRTWGYDNRTVSTRVLTGSPHATRLEFRVPGADVNPYLALAGVLASVRNGLVNGLDPGPASTGDAYVEAAGDPLPSSLLDSARTLRASSLALSSFGPEVVDHYATLAEHEWDVFMSSVTDWDRGRYLESI